MSSGELSYPSVYINQNSLEFLKERNPQIVVENIADNVIRLTYYDGKQNGNGTTLHYRGEHLICDPLDGMWKPLRMSLPVAPETSQLGKFNSHAELYEFIKPLQKYLKNEFSSPSTSASISGSTSAEPIYNRCFAMPKVDGSLMNVSAVKKNSVQGACIGHLKNGAGPGPGPFYHEIEDNIYYIGTRSCLFATQASTIIEPFKESIIATYGSFAAFYEKVHDHLAGIPWTETATVVFEAVPTHPYSGLTVDYGRPFVAHLASIYYKDGGAVIQLPSLATADALHAVPVVEIPCNADAIETYYAAKMEEAVAGSLEDLEGFMMAFMNPSGQLLYMKLKFHWYYVAHKPELYLSDAEQIYTDPKYAHIRGRLANMEASLHAATIKKNPALVFDQFSRLVIQSFSEIRQPTDSRKDFMVRMFKMGRLPHQDAIEDLFRNIIGRLGLSMELSLSKHMASLYDVLTAEDSEKKVADITAFYMKVVKLA